MPLPRDAEGFEVLVPGATLHVRRYGRADMALPALLWLYGNGEVASGYDELAARFLHAGVQLWVMDYRGYGRSSGSPTYRSCYYDALAAAAFVRAQLGTSLRFLVGGRSLGGAFAAAVATAVPLHVDGLVLDSAGADCDRLLARRGLPPAMKATDADRADFDTYRKLRRCEVPVLLLHGEKDGVIPVTEAEQNAHAIKRPSIFVRIPDRGHNDLFADPAYWSALASFVAT